MNKQKTFITLIVVGIVITIILVVAAFITQPFEGHEDELTGETESNQMGSFSGYVVDALTNRPLPNASVRVSGVGSAETVTTDEKGAFKVVALPGNYLLTPSLDTYVLSGKDDQGRDVGIVRDTHFVRAILKLQPAATIEGRILANNRPEVARILMHYEVDGSGAEDYVFGTFTSNEEGYFEIRDAYEGRINLHIELDGFAPMALESIALKPGERVDLGAIPLLEGCSISGFVRSDTDGKPVPNAALELVDKEGNVLTTAQADANGHYRFSPILTKDVTLRASADAFAFHTQNISLDGKVVFQKDITLAPSRGLKINALNLTRRGDERMQIIIKDLQTLETIHDDMVDSGVIHLEDIEGGPFSIQAISPDALTQTSVRANLGSEVNLILKAWPKLTIRGQRNGQTPDRPLSYKYTYTPMGGGDPTDIAWRELPLVGDALMDLRDGEYDIEVRDLESGRMASGSMRLLLGDDKEILLNVQDAPPVAAKAASDSPRPTVDDAQPEADNTNANEPEDVDDTEHNTEDIITL